MDLSTTYLGMELSNPVVASASPLSQTLSGIRELEDAGAAAVVMYSLFEEQIEHQAKELNHFLDYGAESYGEALSYFPDLEHYNVGPDEYLNLIWRAKQSVDIPIIGSLNGATPGGWVEYAKKIEEAGADALELNMYYIAADPDVTGAQVNEMYLDVVEAVRANISIPLAVKIGPYFASVANMSKRFIEAGANGLVFFNRFYQPDFDLETLEVVPHLVLSRQFTMRLPLRWVALLYGRLDVDFAITSGVHTYEDVLKCMMAGAKVSMMASELLKNGVGRIREIQEEMVRWMEEREYESVRQMQGSMSAINVGDTTAFERANYMKVLQSWRSDPTGVLLA